ncbi:hypothetical protein [Sicyoidochytrium minutum DNA virus]|nr:hypothetical protein [Sicyoidochytrium minutum DNA virus]
MGKDTHMGVRSRVSGAYRVLRGKDVARDPDYVPPGYVPVTTDNPYEKTYNVRLTVPKFNLNRALWIIAGLVFLGLLIYITYWMITSGVLNFGPGSGTDGTVIDGQCSFLDSNPGENCFCCEDRNANLYYDCDSGCRSLPFAKRKDNSVCMNASTNAIRCAYQNTDT